MVIVSNLILINGVLFLNKLVNLVQIKSFLNKHLRNMTYVVSSIINENYRFGCQGKRGWIMFLIFKRFLKVRSHECTPSKMHVHTSSSVLYAFQLIVLICHVGLVVFLL